MPEPARTLLRHERVVLPDGALLEIELWRAAPRALRYRLCYRRGGACLLQYDNERRGRARRRLRGRSQPYAFRSVEQLRYDFERDVEALDAPP